MKIVVTGAAGFIGSNIIKGLNARGITNIIAVDDLTQGDKFRNIADLKIADYLDKDVFYELFAENALAKSKPSSTKALAATPWRAMAST